MLQWDVVATRWLAICYLGMKKADEAVAICESVIRQDPKASRSPELRGVYWNALLKAERYPKLRDVLTKAEEEGDMTIKARVEIARGDIERQQGNFEEALVKGYLRAITLYENVKEIQPEALYKSILCFKALGQTTYAKQRLETLTKQYPDDPYTPKARAAL